MFDSIHPWWTSLHNRPIPFHHRFASHESLYIITLEVSEKPDRVGSNQFHSPRKPRVRILYHGKTEWIEQRERAAGSPPSLVSPWREAASYYAPLKRLDSSRFRVALNRGNLRSAASLDACQLSNGQKTKTSACVRFRATSAQVGRYSRVSWVKLKKIQGGGGGAAVVCMARGQLFRTVHQMFTPASV